MRIRFQADADLDARVIHGLRRTAPEIDIRSAADARLSGLDDPAVLKISKVDGRMLITQEPPHHARSFCALHNNHNESRRDTHPPPDSHLARNRRSCSDLVHYSTRGVDKPFDLDSSVAAALSKQRSSSPCADRPSFAMAL